MVLHQSFYEAAATTMPILLLALVLGEGRLRVKTDPSLKDAFYVFLVIAIIVLGELLSFAVLAGGRDTTWEAIVILVALTTALASILIGFLALVAREVRGIYGDRPSTLWFTTACSLAALVIVIGGFFVIASQASS